MNFYSENILNDIIDNSPIEKIIEEVDEIYDYTKWLLMWYSKHIINFNYIRRLSEDKSVKYAYRCIGSEFDFSNIPSIMAYSRINTDNEIHYYVLLICTKHKYKNMGYASALLDDFILVTRNKYANNNRNVKIILSSVEEAVTYYEKYGFKWTRKCLKDYPHLLSFEHYEEGKEYFMMELDL